MYAFANAVSFNYLLIFKGKMLLTNMRICFNSKTVIFVNNYVILNYVIDIFVLCIVLTNKGIMNNRHNTNIYCTQRTVDN